MRYKRAFSRVLDLRRRIDAALLSRTSTTWTSATKSRIEISFVVRCIRHAMFYSMPEDQYPMPVALGPPGAIYWGALRTTMSMPWFVLSLRAPDVGGPSHTVLMAQDIDLAKALRAFTGSVDALICIMYRFDCTDAPIAPMCIREVWDGSCDDMGASPCVIFVGADGKEYLGPYMDVNPGANRVRMIASISH